MNCNGPNSYSKYKIDDKPKQGISIDQNKYSFDS